MMRTLLKIVVGDKTSVYGSVLLLSGQFVRQLAQCCGLVQQ